MMLLVPVFLSRLAAGPLCNLLLLQCLHSMIPHARKMFHAMLALWFVAFAVRQLVLAKRVTTMVRVGYLHLLWMARPRVLEHCSVNVFAAPRRALARCVMTMVALA